MGTGRGYVYCTSKVGEGGQGGVYPAKALDTSTPLYSELRALKHTVKAGRNDYNEYKAKIVELGGQVKQLKSCLNEQLTRAQVRPAHTRILGSDRPNHHPLRS